MATYTLSHTGAEVDAAVNNATNLFSTAHTWTADQTFGNVLIPTGTLDAATVAGANANFGDLLIGDYPTSRLTVDAPATFHGATEIASAGSFTVGSPSTFNADVTVNGDVSATFVTAEDGSIATDLSVGSALDVGGDARVAGTVYAGAVSSPSFRIPARVSVEFSAASVTAAHDGVYIASGASALTPFSAGATIPSGVLIIYFL